MHTKPTHVCLNMLWRRCFWVIHVHGCQSSLPLHKGAFLVFWFVAFCWRYLNGIVGIETDPVIVALSIILCTRAVIWHLLFVINQSNLFDFVYSGELIVPICLRCLYVCNMAVYARIIASKVFLRSLLSLQPTHRQMFTLASCTSLCLQTWFTIKQRDLSAFMMFCTIWQYYLFWLIE